MSRIPRSTLAVRKAAEVVGWDMELKGGCAVGGWLHQFAFLSFEYQSSSFSTSSPAFVVICILCVTHSGMRWNLSVVLICISLMT